MVITQTSSDQWELMITIELGSARALIGEGNGTPLQYSCLENPMDGGAWWATVHGVSKSQTQLSDFTFTFHFHALEKEMATHSSILAWRIPGTVEPVGLPVYRVAQSWTRLKRLSSSSSRALISPLTSWNCYYVYDIEYHIHTCMYGQVGNWLLEWVSSCLSFHGGTCELAIERPTIPYVDCHEPAPWLLNIWVKRRLETKFLWRDLWSCNELSPPFGRNSSECCPVTSRSEEVIKRTDQRAPNCTSCIWRTQRPNVWIKPEDFRLVHTLGSDSP